MHMENRKHAYVAPETTAWALTMERELLIIPGASYVDLYDDVAGVIPYDKMEAFFKASAFSGGILL